MYKLENSSMQERAKKIRMLAVDVDGVLTDGRLYFDQHGNELKAFYTRDGLGMKALQRFGIELAIITGRKSRIVEDRATQLGIKHVYQGRDDKLNALKELVSESGIAEEQICYVGDDWIDLPVLQRVGLAVAPSDAAKMVREQVHWVTESAGGHGAVREVCEYILSAQDLDERLKQAIFES